MINKLTTYPGLLTSIILIIVLLSCTLDYLIIEISIPNIKLILVFAVGMKLGSVWYGMAKKIEKNKLSLERILASNKYKKGSGNIELSNALRALVYRYKATSDDFMLNISMNNNIIIQILHRAHFPDVLNSEDDNRFGMVFYSPVSNEKRLSLLEDLLKSESIKYYVNTTNKSLFFELGDSYFTGFANYIITKILYEVFDDGKSVNFQLGYVGKLPYVQNDS